MIAVISPAKRLDEGPAPAGVPWTTPALLAEAEKLMVTTRRLTRPKIAKLMDLSRELADLNHQRFQALTAEHTPENAKQAALLFAGDTYTGLAAPTLTPDDLAWAQDHLRILSGLYGVLRPLDLIRPHRLEMATKLPTRRGRDLYAFWGDRITDGLNHALAGHREKVLVNLASEAYFTAVRPKRLDARVVEPVFKEERGGKLQVVSFTAKKLRGAMARYFIERRAESPEVLQGFEQEGYRYRPELSDVSTWVFAR